MKAFDYTDPAQLVAEVERLRSALTEALETIATGSEMRRRFVARAMRAEARVAELEDLLGRTVDGALAQGWDLVATRADLADALNSARGEGPYVPPVPDTSADALASSSEIAAIKRREDA